MLLKFNEEWARSSVNGALAIRKDINRIVDEICAQGYRNICWLGIGEPGRAVCRRRFI